MNDPTHHPRPTNHVIITITTDPVAGWTVDALVDGVVFRILCPVSAVDVGRYLATLVPDMLPTVASDEALVEALREYRDSVQDTS